MLLMPSGEIDASTGLSVLIDVCITSAPKLAPEIWDPETGQIKNYSLRLQDSYHRQSLRRAFSQ